jgi:chromosome partitioning protein
MRKITLLSQKGGAGKSTLATQLGVWATQSDELVCIVDLDPQGSAALWRDFRKSRLPLVQRALPDRLATVASEAASMGVTVLIVDTAPHLDRTALEAIRVADLIVCPTKPDLLNLGAVADTIKLLDMAQSKGKALAVINDLPTAAKTRAVALETSTLTLQKSGIDIAKTTISHSPQMVDAIALGMGITEKLPKNAASKEIAALWAEIVSRTGEAAVKEAAQ